MGPNFLNHLQMVSLEIPKPRLASISSISRKLKVKRAQIQIE